MSHVEFKKYPMSCHLYFFLMSLSSMSHVDFKKYPVADPTFQLPPPPPKKKMGGGGANVKCSHTLHPAQHLPPSRSNNYELIPESSRISFCSTELLNNATFVENKILFLPSPFRQLHHFLYVFDRDAKTDRPGSDAQRWG